jgi:hypothetical protein
MAILTVLTVIPKQAQITIFCDSKAAIQGIQNILYNNVKACRNLKNIHILSNIQHISQTQQIQIKLTKVAAHTGIDGNEIADKLAKSALESIHNIVEPTFIQNLPFTNISFWDNTLLEVPIKQGIKRCLLAKHIIQWRLLNRNRINISSHTLQAINWKQSTTNLHPTKMTNSHTNVEDHCNRSFKNKLWNLELPTKTKLHNRSPNIYTNNICTKCNKEPETTIHPFICGAQIHCTKSQIQQIFHEEINSHADQNKQHKIVQEINKHTNTWTLEILQMVIRGGIPQHVVNTINKHISRDHIQDCFNNISNRINSYLRKIWSERCDRFALWEKTQKIGKKHKKQWQRQKQNTANQKEDQEIKDRYPLIINKYMAEYINNLAGLEKMFTISININGYGSALTC